jgi:mRNA interferase MazF
VTVPLIIGHRAGASTYGTTLSTMLVAPTSTSAQRAIHRPTIELGGEETRVLVEQTTVVDPQRLGRSAGCLSASEMRDLDEALALILALR